MFLIQRFTAADLTLGTAALGADLATGFLTAGAAFAGPVPEARAITMAAAIRRKEK
jgi:hypothetical protein